MMMMKQPTLTTLTAKIVSLFCLVAGMALPFASAADYDPTLGPDPRKSYDIHVGFGSFLPAKNGLTENIPGWTFKFGVPTGKGVFEFGSYAGAGNGIIYRSLAADYRMDLAIDFLAAHFLIGLHGDQFYSEQRSIGFAGGWHYGGGISQYIGGPLLARFDFRQRFSPGQALEVTLGFTWRFGSGGA